MLPAWPFVIGLTVALLGMALILAAPALPYLKRGSVALFVVGSILYGGIGSGVGWRFRSETGIFDAGSYVDYSSNTIHAHWGYQPQAAGSKFKWFYTYKYGSEHKGPFQLPDANVADCHASYKFDIPDGEELKTMVITCYADFVAPPTVVTNGVYHLSGVMRSLADTNSVAPKYVTPMIKIEIDGKILTPTNTLSTYQQKDK